MRSSGPALPWLTSTYPPATAASTAARDTTTIQQRGPSFTTLDLLIIHRSIDGHGGKRRPRARAGSIRPMDEIIGQGGCSSMATHRIAVMPGDGIGKEVMPEGVRALDAAAKRFGIALEYAHFDWSCDYY